jgi:hypothetical protein
MRPPSAFRSRKPIMMASCNPRCRNAMPSDHPPNLRTHVRLNQNDRPADRRRRPADRLRHARRVRAGARWENRPSLRSRSQAPDHPPVPPSALRRHYVCFRFPKQPLLRHPSRSAPRVGAVARCSRSKRDAVGERRGVAALREPFDGRVARRSSGTAARTNPWRGPHLRTGGDLLSQEVALQVPSALRGLTALFGMGRGVSPSLCATGNFSRPPRWSLKTAQDLRVRNIRQALDPLVPVS